MIELKGSIEHSNIKGNISPVTNVGGVIFRSPSTTKNKNGGTICDISVIGYIPITGKAGSEWNTINKITAIGTLQE